MKHLTKAEAAELDKSTKRTMTHRSTHPVLLELATLQVGDTLLVDKTDWDMKNPLGGVIWGWAHGSTANLIHGRKYSVQVLIDNQGWLVTRVEDKA